MLICTNYLKYYICIEPIAFISMHLLLHLSQCISCCIYLNASPAAFISMHLLLHLSQCIFCCIYLNKSAFISMHLLQHYLSASPAVWGNCKKADFEHSLHSRKIHIYWKLSALEIPLPRPNPPTPDMDRICTLPLIFSMSVGTTMPVLTSPLFYRSHHSLHS